MDAWSPDQLKKMQLGGNEPMNTFFAKYGVSKTTDIKEKYNSTAAEVGSPVSAGYHPFEKYQGTLGTRGRQGYLESVLLNLHFFLP